METHIATIDDVWSDKVTYKVNKGSTSYIKQRKSNSWHPLGPNEYTYNRLIKFTIGSMDWMDGSTCKLS